MYIYFTDTCIYFSNMLVQVVVGIPLEMVHGFWRILIIYMAGVLAGEKNGQVYHNVPKIMGITSTLRNYVHEHFEIFLCNASLCYVDSNISFESLLMEVIFPRIPRLHCFRIAWYFGIRHESLPCRGFGWGICVTGSSSSERFIGKNVTVIRCLVLTDAFMSQLAEWLIRNTLSISLTDRPSRGSSGGRVVKLLACGARGQGFDSPPPHLNFRDWLSPASKSRYGWNTAKATWIFNTNQPTNQPTNNYASSSHSFWLSHFSVAINCITNEFSDIFGYNTDNPTILCTDL